MAPQVQLDDVRVASPCEVAWDKMRGNERVRFCNQCGLNVFNLSEMTREEAQDMIQKTEGRLCVRYHQRADGTLITKDCPVGVWKQHRRKSFALMFAAAAGTLLAAVTDSPVTASLQNTEPIRTLRRWLKPAGRATMGKVVVMGAMQAPFKSPKTSTTNSR